MSRVVKALPLLLLICHLPASWADDDSGGGDEDADPAQGLRTLAQSAPYLHTGAKDTLEDVVRFYVAESALARAGRLRNGARELRAMQIGEDDVAPLAAFLRSLNEDYE
jgi:cytochrome c peroxidase